MCWKPWPLRKYYVDCIVEGTLNVRPFLTYGVYALFSQTGVTFHQRLIKGGRGPSGSTRWLTAVPNGVSGFNFYTPCKDTAIVVSKSRQRTCSEYDTRCSRKETAEKFVVDLKTEVSLARAKEMCAEKCMDLFTSVIRDRNWAHFGDMFCLKESHSFRGESEHGQFCSACNTVVSYTARVEVLAIFIDNYR